MTREVCEVCTGSYTGEFSPKWRGPFAEYFDASGNFIEAHEVNGMTDVTKRMERRKESRALNRVPLGMLYR